MFIHVSCEHRESDVERRQDDTIASSGPRIMAQRAILEPWQPRTPETTPTDKDSAPWPRPPSMLIALWDKWIQSSRGSDPH